MAAYPEITSYPPLRQLSLVAGDSDNVTIFVDMRWSSVARPRFDFQFHLCTADVTSAPAHASLWTSYAMTRQEKTPASFGEEEDLFCDLFAVSLSPAELFSTSSPRRAFTFKYRVADNMQWQWPSANGDIETGELLKTTEDALSLESASQLLVVEAGWESTSMITSPNGSLFSVSSNKAIPSSDRGSHQKVLGTVKRQIRYFATACIEPPWMGPRHGGNFFYLAEPAMVCSFLRDDGNVITVAAPSIGQVRSVLRSNERGQIVVDARDDGATGLPFRVVISVASDLERSLAMVMQFLREESNEAWRLAGGLAPIIENANEVMKRREDWLEGLGFCTWNALGSDLSSERICSALGTLREHDIRISTLLVDDGWQTLGPTALPYSNPAWRGMAAFGAHAEGFPDGGLSGLVTRVKAENPLVSDIGVWHALMGYWGGFSREGWIVNNYGTIQSLEGKLYYNTPSDKMVSVTAEDLDRFYDDFYAYLASCGISFVKTDVQCVLSDIEQSCHRKELIPAYQRAWTSAYTRNLGLKAIGCMSQVPEMLWRMHLQNATSAGGGLPPVLRNSDDFFPEIPSSHPWHLWANAHNAIIGRHLNAVLDWDMFQTSHAYGLYHAAARSLSGGPVYITDMPGEHDVKVLDAMTSPSPEGGRSLVLRLPEAGRTPRAFDKYQESGLLKITNATAGGVKLMGLFNVDEKPISGLVSVAEVVGAPSSGNVLCLSYATQRIHGPMDALADGGSNLLHFKMDVAGCDVISAFDIRSLPNGTSVCTLGLLGKITGSAAVCGEVVYATGDNEELMVSIPLKALGKLGIWLKDVSKTGSQRRMQANIHGLAIGGHQIELESLDDGACLVKIDLLAAWREAGRFPEGPKVVDVTVVLGWE